MPSDPLPAHGLSRHILFVRSLALVSGAALGIAVGATLIGGGGCGGCTGICGRQQPMGQDGGGADARDDSATDASNDGGAGGGPLGAPPLPTSWIA